MNTRAKIAWHLHQAAMFRRTARRAQTQGFPISANSAKESTRRELRIARVLVGAALAAGLAGCTTLAPEPSSGIRVAYQAADGTVRIRSLEQHLDIYYPNRDRGETKFISTGILQEGHMEAPR